MQPWIPVVITLCLGVAGLGIQGLLLAYFLGRMKEHQAGQSQLVETFQQFTQQALAALTTRMSALDGIASESKSDRAAITARLGSIEQSTEGVPRFREDFAAFRATAIAHQERMESEVGRILQAQDGIQRQLQTLALRQPGKVLELPATGADRV